MNFLIKEATVIDPSSSYHNQKVAILIDNGTIKKIGSNLKTKSDYKVIELPNLHISQGWFDSSVSFGEPGYEERETLKHGMEVAARSGFTHIALQPDMIPVADQSTTINFIRSQGMNHAVQLHPFGALTTGSLGEDLAELFDMYQMGALAFGDYKKAIKNPNLLKIALQYTQSFNGLIQSFPQDTAIASSGVMNEGHQSTLLGLKGLPALAEELQIQRDLFILEYTGGRLHIPTISTEKSLNLIKAAKKKGLQVTCSVAVHNLILTDDLIDTFDTRYKVLPPLRTEKDTLALEEGVKNQVIDMVTSDHRPMDIENKKTEFEYSEYGTVGLEHSFTTLNHCFNLETTIHQLTAGKKVFNITKHAIEEGNIADICFFNPDGEYITDTHHILSTSKNSAFLGQPAKGKVYGVLNKGILNITK